MSSDFISFFEREIDLMFSNEPFDDHVNKELTPLSHFIKKDATWVLEMDLPMVDKKDIKITLSDNHITIRAKLKKTFCIPKRNMITEFNYFRKTIPIPNTADAKNITAVFKKGILTITIPKISKGKPIKIQ